LGADGVDEAGTVVVARGEDLGDPQIEALLAAGITQIKVRSVLTCTTGTGVCVRPATDARWPPASWSTSVRPWVSLRRNRLVSPARS